MDVNLSPVAGAAAQFFDNSGNVLTGGKIYTYLAGTTTPAITYTTNSGTTAHPNPIVLNAAGRVPDSGEVWVSNGVSYKFVLKDTNEILIATYDNIKGINDAAFTKIVNFTGDGTTAIFTLPIFPLSKNWVNIFINGVYQFKNTFSLNGNTLTFSEAPPMTSKIEVEY